MHVLVFDSGVGGLSVLESVQLLNPHLQYSYLFDNRYFPYGELSEPELIERVCELVAVAVAKLQIDMVVIACNSASTLALPKLRSQHAIPIVGVVPAIKLAASMSQTGHFGILATPGTVERQYTAQLIQDFAANCIVELIGSTELVVLAERKLAGEFIDSRAVHDIVASWLAMEDLDTVVLGCTHFPLLKEELSQVLGEKVQLIDSGPAIAKRVQHLSDDCNRIVFDHKKAEVSAYCTLTSANTGLVDQLTAYGINSLQLID
ncbi:glutamate racemase [Agarivorans sp. QJM3NY_25]|uniref:glutamate racemase n=1 Tax=Agarivorans sp. QJM3NY_25 TaxID=3421430 RepID=UPI003D7C50CD